MRISLCVDMFGFLGRNEDDAGTKGKVKGGGLTLLWKVRIHAKQRLPRLVQLQRLESRMQAPGKSCHGPVARELAGGARALTEAEMAMFCSDSQCLAWTAWSFACRWPIRNRPVWASRPSADQRSEAMPVTRLEQTCSSEGCSSWQSHRAQFRAEPGGFWCSGVTEGSR